MKERTDKETGHRSLGRRLLSPVFLGIFTSTAGLAYGAGGSITVDHGLTGITTLKMGVEKFSRGSHEFFVAQE